MEENLILNKLRDKYKEKMKDINNAEDLLNKYNPWTNKKIEALSKDFFEALENDKEFSWLQIFDEKNFEFFQSLEKKELSNDYYIPTHVHGDIDKSNLFLCLVNPNINLEVESSESIKNFYKRAYKYTITQKEEDRNESLLIINENDEIIKDTSFIEDYIINIKEDGGIFYNEIKYFKKYKKMKYYLRTYLRSILSTYVNANIPSLEELNNILVSSLKGNAENVRFSDIENMTKKITNLEAYPFGSSLPQITRNESKKIKRFSNQIIDSDTNLNMLSARIVIWKIADYLINKDNESKIKPIFIFRRFDDAWLPSLKKVINKDLELKKDCEDILFELHENFFLTIGKQDNYRPYFISKTLFKNNSKISEEEFDRIIRKSIIDN